MGKAKYERDRGLATTALFYPGGDGVSLGEEPMVTGALGFPLSVERIAPEVKALFLLQKSVISRELCRPLSTGRASLAGRTATALIKLLLKEDQKKCQKGVV